MKVALLAAQVSVAMAIPANIKSLDEIARAINADPESTWQAYDDGRFASKTLADVKAHCGTILPGDANFVDTQIREPTFEELGLDPTLGVEDLPASFDWRDNAQCKNVIGLIRDQSACGSCWAMSASECFTDRRCVQANDTKIYSSMDVAANCHGLLCGLSNGCGGGQQGGE
jgi:cathepsin B